MKKVYLFSLSIFATAALTAQTNIQTETIKHELNTQLELNENRPTVLSQNRAGGDIIWQDGFDVAADWTADGPSGDYNLNGWTIGSVRNSPWVTAFQSGDMGTSGNFARLAVEQPSTITSGPFTLTYNNVIDLTGIPAPQIMFEQSGARFVTIQAIEVSTDGGTTWTQVGNNNDIPPLTGSGGSAYGVPDTRQFNIGSAVAANPSNVMVRLLWDGAQNGPNINYVDYGWYVDNVRIVEGYSYETALVEPIYRMGVGLTYTNGLEYHFIPTTQISDIQYAGKIQNNGGVIQTGAQLDVSIMKAGSNVYTASSTPSDIALFATDSFAVMPAFTPSGLGTYDVTMTATQTNAENDLTDNVSTHSFEVTDYTFGRDNGIEEGSLSNVGSNSGSDLQIGNVMNIFNNGLIGAIDIKITSTAANVGKIMYGAIYTLNSAGDAYDWAGQTDDYTIQNGDLNSFVKLFLPSPVNLTAGQEILIVAGHYGDDVEFSTAQVTEDGTVLGFTSSGSSLFQLTGANAFMIRADMRDFSGVEEVAISNINVSQNVPNPFTANTVISYNLNEIANVTLKVVDVTGKLIKTINEGNKVAGAHNITIDGTNLAAGTYFYTLTAGDYQVTKRMVVTK